MANLRANSRLLNATRSLSVMSLGAALLGCAAGPSLHLETPQWPAANQQSTAPELEAATFGPVQQKTRQVGDRTVHRFTGTFNKHALTLTEEVVATNADTFTVRCLLDEGVSTTELLVTRGNRSERVIAVVRVESGQEIEGNVSDYEELLQKTLFTPDQNHGEVAKRSQTCLVGSSEHDCEIAEYRVYIADQEARLSVARSAELGRDVSGEIVGVDGTMIYHAELIDMKQADHISYDQEVAVIVPLP